jgi:hypothetical protein
MTSSGSGDILRHDGDLPTTAHDVAALWRLRHGRRLTFDEYAEGLGRLAPPAADVLRLRSGPAGEPFELL